jgi:hypothetical protein
MDKVLGAWNYLSLRLAEPSTHASVAALLTLAGTNLDSGLLHDSMVAVGVAFGTLGFFVKETSSVQS